MVPILSSSYLAPIQYYVKILHSKQSVIDNGENYIKQSYRNRCVIDSANGPLALTIPICKKKEGKILMKDVEISDHGNWRHLHQQAFISSYENTPYFEFYADDFLSIFEKKITYLIDFNRALQQLMCKNIDFLPNIKESESYVTATSVDEDFRARINPKVDFFEDKYFKIVPYYQMFKERHAFLPNLSIADLLFNMGPESLIILRQSFLE